MKVIRKGREQKGWAREIECSGSGNGGGGCSALLLVEQDDVFQTSRSYYDGTTDTFATFKCVACGVWSDIKERVPFTPEKRSP